MSSSLPAYQNILSQATALEQAAQWHAGPGAAALMKAAALLRQARSIALVAIGASYNAAIPFVHRLAAAGRPVALEDAAEFLHYTHARYTSPTLFLFISRSGGTIEITRSMERIRGRGHTLIGVTNEPDSPLATQADLALIFGGPTDQMVAIQTYQTTLLTLDLLAEAVLGDLDAPAFRAELNAMVQAVRQVTEQYAGPARPAFDLHAPRGIYLLGRGPSLSSAIEATLVFHEMGRYPAQAFGAGSFRHGAWEVVDERIRAMVFAPPDQTLALNLALAQDLARLGAQVILLAGPQPEWNAPENLAHWRLPALSARWSPYLEIIPIQFYVFEFAIRHGLTPGEFRAASQVITSETGSLAGGQE